MKARFYFVAQTEVEIDVEDGVYVADIDRARELLDKPHWVFEEVASEHPCEFCGTRNPFDHSDHPSTALDCEHANEVPCSCPCNDDCYCKNNSCQEGR